VKRIPPPGVSGISQSPYQRSLTIETVLAKTEQELLQSEGDLYLAHRSAFIPYHLLGLFLGARGRKCWWDQGGLLRWLSGQRLGERTGTLLSWIILRTRGLYDVKRRPISTLVQSPAWFMPLSRRFILTLYGQGIGWFLWEKTYQPRSI